MRIIGGSWRNRKLSTPDGKDVRPTADRARESLFSILEHSGTYDRWQMAGATVLDVFAGTGALGLEALSRGAKQVIFIDASTISISIINRNIKSVKASERAKVLCQDATKLGPSKIKANLAFLDPPYRSGLAEQSLSGLMKAGWLGISALAIVETSEKEVIIPPEKFALLEKRRCGGATFWFLNYLPGPAKIEPKQGSAFPLTT